MLDGIPPDASDLSQQPQMHVAFDGVLIGGGPRSVAFPCRQRAVVAERGETQNTY
jgi:hypothetical protein